MNANNININNPKEWKGSNILGWALMDFRDSQKIE